MRSEWRHQPSSVSGLLVICNKLNVNRNWHKCGFGGHHKRYLDDNNGGYLCKLLESYGNKECWAS
jgi:hypothetical protein